MQYNPNINHNINPNVKPNNNPDINAAMLSPSSQWMSRCVA
jgi:hypothetical protein